MRGLARHLTYDHFRTLFLAKDSSVVDNLDWSFHYDIVAGLPVEISQKIFLYLPLYQCFQAQRVSRRWRELLSAPQTMECLIRWWYPRGETDLCISDGLSIEAVMNLKAEHIDAFRTGHPFSKSTLSGVPDVSPILPIKGIAYAGGVLAWIDPSPFDRICRYIETLDLKTYLRRYFCAEDRTSFHTIAITSSIIAALDLIGRCHVWDITHRDRRYLLQLPSAKYDSMEASSTALAIASSGQNKDGKIEIFTWSSQSMKSQVLLLPLHLAPQMNSSPKSKSASRPVRARLSHDWKIMLDPKGESLFLFQMLRSQHYVASDSPRDLFDLYFTRMSLDGQIRAQGQSEWLSSTYSASTDRDWFEKTRTVEVNNFATLWFFYPLMRASASDSQPCDMIVTRIGFNFERCSLEVEEKNLGSAGTGLYYIDRPLIWKDIVYWGDPALTNSRIVDFRESTCAKTKLASKWPFEFCEGIVKFIGDETFLILVGAKDWKVWCFDKNIQMANEDLEYREARSKRLSYG